MIDIPVEGRLTDKAIIVSGAGQAPGETVGNGKAIALLCNRAGAKVLCVDRDEARARQTVDEIMAAGGIAQICTADITKQADAQRCIAECLSAFGSVDGLVNNVGIGSGHDGPVHKLDEDVFDTVMKINLKGAMLMSKAALGAMRKQQSGAIVNISSLASLAGAFQTSYEVSKAAMNRMTQSIALSNAKKGVRCNAILPGLMDTPMAIEGISQATGQPVDELRAQRAGMVPMGHMGDGWDIAHAALFLLSDEARFITGVLLPVDGGSAARIG